MKQFIVWLLLQNINEQNSLSLFRFFLFSSVLLSTGCGSGRFTESGKASYYSQKLRGNKMANGQPYRPGKKTAAHKTLPFGTRVKVTSPETGKSVKVIVTDRGPFVQGRIIDLSYKAAKKIGMIKAGVIRVEIKARPEK